MKSAILFACDPAVVWQKPVTHANRIAKKRAQARVWSQGGDSPDVIDEAINTCPVDCIYYVSVEDLETLEKERDARNADRSRRASRTTHQISVRSAIEIC